MYNTESKAFLGASVRPWFETKADITSHCFAQAAQEFVDSVVPDLQRRRLFRDDDTGTLLRDPLGFAASGHARTAR